MPTPVLEILGKIHIYEKKKLSDPQREKLLTYYFNATASIPIVAVAIGFLGYTLERNDIKIISLAVLVAAYLLICFTPVFTAMVYRVALKNFFQNSLLPQLTNTSVAIAANTHFAPQLMNCSLSELEITAIEFKTERDALERRIGLIAGAIDKVGLGPGLLAAIAAILKLQTDLQGIEFKGLGAADWLLGAAFGVLGLYALAAFGHMSILKIDRALKLLEFVITKKKSMKKANVE